MWREGDEGKRVMWGERRRKARQGRREGVRWGRQGRKEKGGRGSHDLSYKRRIRERREGRERGKRKKEGRARGKTHTIPPFPPSLEGILSQA